MIMTTETWTNEADLTDVWAEETDPGNERGEVATGLFSLSVAASEYPTAGGHGSINWRSCEEVEHCHLIGLRIEGDGEPYIIDRATLLTVLGAPRVARLESLVAEDLMSEAA